MRPIDVACIVGVVSDHELEYSHTPYAATAGEGENLSAELLDRGVQRSSIISPPTSPAASTIHAHRRSVRPERNSRPPHHRPSPNTVHRCTAATPHLTACLTAHVFLALLSLLSGSRSRHLRSPRGVPRMPSASPVDRFRGACRAGRAVTPRRGNERSASRSRGTVPP